MASNNMVVIVKKLETKITESGDLIAEYNYDNIHESYDEYAFTQKDVTLTVVGENVHLIINAYLKEPYKRPQYTFAK